VNAQVIELLVLAVVAGIVLARLYATLGRRTGAERPSTPAPQPAQGDLRETLAERPLPGAQTGSASGGLAELMRIDPSFDAGHFMSGARSAYELIVTAFAQGDKDGLRALLTPRVFEVYSKAIDERQARGEKGSELVRLKSADFLDATVDADVARITVKFEAELAEGAHGLRDTKEKWVFERDVRSYDPNWKLARVLAA
jgi:predicted lipid-binding transport protein (Tim44 family)